MLRSLLEGDEGEKCSGPWDQGVGLLQEIKQIALELPEEAAQVMTFVMPDLDSGAQLLAARGDVQAILETLSEPMATMDDLCKDMGEGEENIERMSAVSAELRKVLEECGSSPARPGTNGGRGPDKETLLEALQEEIDVLQTIGASSLSMLEPLSFQDLVGQRIQRIIRLVKSMEVRIEDLIISFGIKIRKHKEFPSKTCEELEQEVEQFKSELRGPQKEGDGLDQGDIDALLASL
jgi:hypothetical protein